MNIGEVSYILLNWYNQTSSVTSMSLDRNSNKSQDKALSLTQILFSFFQLKVSQWLRVLPVADAALITGPLLDSI